MKNFSPIIRAITTEKSSLEQTIGKYTFLVDKDATKIDIKRAIKQMYDVDAKTVRTSIVPKKIRVLKGKFDWAKRPSYKKATVTLKGKKTIDPSKLKEHKK